MPIGPPPQTPDPLRYAVLDIITNAHIEAGYIAPGDDLDGNNAQFTFSKLNDLLDEWNASDQYIFATQFNVYTLTPNLNPHLIGPADANPSATFVTGARPEFLTSANLILNAAGQAVDVPMEIWDDDAYAAVTVKGLATSVQTAVYYNASFPAGELFFYPIPTAALQVRLGFWVPLTGFSDIQQTFWFPPAYRRAVVLTLAEELDGPRSNDPKLAMKAAGARAAVRKNNAQPPHIDDAGSGMPKSYARPRWNFLTGLYE